MSENTTEKTEMKKAEKFSFTKTAEKIGTFLGRIVGHVDNFTNKMKDKCVNGILGDKPRAFRRVLARLTGIVFNNAKLIGVAILIAAAFILIATLVPQIVAMAVVVVTSGVLFACWVLFGKVTEEIPSSAPAA